MTCPSVNLFFHHDLHLLLRKQLASKSVNYILRRRASLKDIIESLNIPHTEVALILLNNREIRFDYIPIGGEKIDILPFCEKVSVYNPTLLRPKLDSLAFMVDINAQKLARNLRILGFDTTLVPELGLVEIGRAAAKQQRILISRNRELLKCKTVIHGHLLQSEHHVAQLKEVVKRYKLNVKVKPFRRCLSCNAILQSVDKKAVFHRLEPLTQKYYNTFKQCSDCKKIYWQGSHHNNMRDLIEETVGSLNAK